MTPKSVGTGVNICRGKHYLCYFPSHSQPTSTYMQNGSCRGIQPGVRTCFLRRSSICKPIAFSSCESWHVLDTAFHRQGKLHTERLVRMESYHWQSVQKVFIYVYLAFDHKECIPVSFLSTIYPLVLQIPSENRFGP